MPAQAVQVVLVSNQLRVYGGDAAEDIRLLLSVDGLRVEIWENNAFVTQVAHSTFTSILIDAGGGNDTITIDESAGAFTNTEPTTILGGAGDDTIAGGSGAETIHGGAGNDLIDAGVGADTILGEAGNDLIVWNAATNLLLPSDGSDLIDGGDGDDAVSVTGSDFAESYGLTPSGQRVLLTRSGGAITLDVGTVEEIGVQMRGGDDSFVPTLPLPTSIMLFLAGGDGDDIIFGAQFARITGGNGNDTLGGGPGNESIQGDAGNDMIFGNAGNDLIAGGAGNDTISGGAGHDVVTWLPGDGVDTFDGQDGTDTVILAGHNAAADLFQVAGPAPGGFVVNHNVFGGNVTSQQVERLEITARGGNDSVLFMATVDGRFQNAIVDLGPGSDSLELPASTPPVVASGGTDHDTLTFRALGLPVDVKPGSISSGGVERVLHDGFEDVALTETAGTLPQVTILSPTSNPSTTSAVPFISLGGSASDAGGIVQTITWSTDRGYSGTGSGDTQWTIADVPLQPGTNLITVQALDNSGNRSSDTISVAMNTLTYSLAEGATGTFFDLDVLLANPTTTPAPVTVTFLRQSGPPITQNLTLAPTSRTTLHVDEIPGLEAQGGISTVVTSTAGVPLVVERTMFWDSSYYGSHGGSAVDGPRTRWLFAEGSEGFFNTFVLLANPGAAASTVTLTFLREGSTPHARTLTVPPNARVTVAANGIPELVGRSFSIVVDATTPIIAERAMYFGPARLFDGGHESTGVAAGAPVWFLAEGATGPFFETFVLIGNPNPAAASAVVTFITDAGQTITRTKTIPPNGRLTINIETEDPALANVSVSTVVTASQPVVVERAMYWPGPPSTWAEAHNSFGTTVASAKWGLAEGRVGMGRGFQTYILLANSNTTAANVRITFLRGNGSTVVKTFTVNPSSRFNVAVNTAAPELQDEAFGALVEVTNGLPIGVERAMYSDALGQTWAAGTNALATRLP